MVIFLSLGYRNVCIFYFREVNGNLDLEVVGAGSEVCMAVFRVRSCGETLLKGIWAVDTQRRHSALQHTYPDLTLYVWSHESLAVLLFRGPSGRPGFVTFFSSIVLE